MRIKKLLFYVVSYILAVTFLTGCSSSEAGSSQKVKTIVVGTGNGFKPYCYLDENGNLAGYEFEVLKAVDELLPQYEFRFETSEFANILLSVESGKVDIGAHQFAVNEERKQKVAFSEESYTAFAYEITVKKGREGIQTLDDLRGKTVEVALGGNIANLLDNYNQEHKDTPIKLVYSSATNEELIANLDSGKIDALILWARVIDEYKKEFGDLIEGVGEPVITSYTYHIFNKNASQLKNDVEGALKALKESGRLAEISEEFLGKDYTK